MFFPVEECGLHTKTAATTGTGYLGGFILSEEILET